VEDYIKQLDTTNLEEMPDDLIGFDGDDEPNDGQHNDSSVGSKRTTPPVSVHNLEKKEGCGVSKFKNESCLK
jgi:hypothetical protein